MFFLVLFFVLVSTSLQVMCNWEYLDLQNYVLKWQIMFKIMSCVISGTTQKHPFFNGVCLYLSCCHLQGDSPAQPGGCWGGGAWAQEEVQGETQGPGGEWRPGGQADLEPKPQPPTVSNTTVSTIGCEKEGLTLRLKNETNAKWSTLNLHYF